MSRKLEDNYGARFVKQLETHLTEMSGKYDSRIFAMKLKTLLNLLPKKTYEIISQYESMGLLYTKNNIVYYMIDEPIIIEKEPPKSQLEELAEWHKMENRGEIKELEENPPKSQSEDEYETYQINMAKSGRTEHIKTFLEWTIQKEKIAIQDKIVKDRSVEE